ncbi:MAG: 2-oxoacid:acceptor oxidoreductase family protein [Clostridium sp.]|nr:2-oxoacid:acceptor oxidoreductase family protein [Clostridium sp.]
MEPKIVLPFTDENGYYQIRLESIGGLGANLCGKMLGELGIKYLGLNSASFSSYGSEKTGTPVKGFIRYSPADLDIKLHSPIKTPHLLVIFHDALLYDASVLNGCEEYTDIIVNSVNGKDSYEALEGKIHHDVYFLDAQRIAIETKSRINVVMLGAIAKVMGFVELEHLYAICRDTLGKKYPAFLSQNMEGIRRGYEEVTKTRNAEINNKITEKAIGKTTGKTNQQENKESNVRTHKKINERTKTTDRKAPQDNNQASSTWGYEAAPIGGINPYFGNSVANDLSPSRQGYFPIFIPEKCINCGLCDTTCPDMVFQFQKGEFKGREMMVNKGLDYYHCKGCLRCVAVCPVQALVRGVEAEHPHKKYFMPNQELLRNPHNYEKAGYDGYITSEAFLTEQRIKGGEI